MFPTLSPSRQGRKCDTMMHQLGTQQPPSHETRELHCLQPAGVIAAKYNLYLRCWRRYMYERHQLESHLLLARY